MAPSPRTSTKNQTQASQEETMSSPSGYFSCSQNSAKVAGYLSLQDTDQLFAFIELKSFDTVYKDFVGIKTPQLRTRTVGSRILAQIARKDYGKAAPNVTGWDPADWRAHHVTRVLALENALPGTPKFGPFGAESELERYNRVLQLFMFVTYSHNAEQTFWPKTTTRANNPAVIPKFMQRAAVNTGTPAQMGTVLPPPPSYPRHQFTGRITNVEGLKTTFPNSTFPDQVQLADPRVYDGDHVRDDIRRKLGMASLSIDIHYFRATNGEDTYDAMIQWDEVQSLCRQTGVDLKGIRFELTTRSVHADTDIFERLIPQDLDDIFVVDPETRDVTLRRGPNGILAADGGTAETPAAPTAGPDDFLGNEEPVDDFDPESQAQAEVAKKVQFQRTMLKRLAKANTRVVVQQKFRTVSEAEATDVQTSGELQHLVDDHGHLSPDDVESIRGDMRSRGGEVHVGPDYLRACNELGFIPHAQQPQLKGSSFIYKAVQVTGMAWMCLQTYGKIPRGSQRIGDSPPMLPNHGPLSATRMDGGILGDAMGVGKTEQILGFLLWDVQFIRKVEHRPTLILCPSSIVYQWVDNILAYYKGFKVYLYHGSDTGPHGQKHQDIRISTKDLASYTGNAATNLIAPRLRFMFDRSNPDASKVLLVAGFRTFSERSSLREVVESEEDPEKMVEQLGNKFPNVFGHVIMDEGQAVKNPSTKLAQSIKLLNASYHWVVTGTPFANRVEDFIGLGSIIYRDAWLQDIPQAHRAAVESKDFFPYTQNFAAGDARRKLMLHPSNLKKLFKRNEVEVAHGLNAVNQMIMLRRTSASDIPCGDTTLRVGTSLPVLQTRTVSVSYDGPEEAEMQLYQRFYATEYTKRLGRFRKSKESGEKSFGLYPTAFWRRMCLLADGVSIERLMRYCELNGLGTNSTDVYEWRDQGIDYRWVVDKIRLASEPPMIEKADYLEYLAKFTPKLRFLASFVEQVVVGAKEKIVVFYDWAHFGLLIELFFRAMYIKVAVIHAGMTPLDRSQVAKSFSDPADKSIQMLIVSDRVGGLGFNMQGDCAWCVIAEAAVNVAAELQALSRIHRQGNTKPSVRVTRLKLMNSFDDTREYKQQEKMLGEIASWSEGKIMQEKMKTLLMETGIEEDKIDLQDAKQLKLAADKIVATMQGRTMLRRDAGNAQLPSYSNLKRSAREAEMDK